MVQGVALGSLYGIIGVGLILIYRTNRIINFAAAAVGAVPAILALLLDVQRHVNYLMVLPIVLVGGPLMGALVDVFVIRRFSKSPRLILTVVTIGVAQSLAILGFFIPVWLGARAGEIPTVPTPWENLKILNGRGQPLLTGNQVAASSPWSCWPCCWPRSCATPASASPCGRRPRTPTARRCSASPCAGCRRWRGWRPACWRPWPSSCSRR